MIYWNDADFSQFKRFSGRNKYSNLIGAFDIETTTIFYPEDDPYDPGEPKFSFMYIWQFAIMDQVVYGRYWWEFAEFLDNLHADLNLKIDNKLIIYVHNLKYEFAFMRKIKELRYSQDPRDFLTRDRNDVIKCVIQDVFEFRDSLAVTEMPLEKMGDIIGIEKLKGYNYELIRTPSTPLSEFELNYCAHDVLILTHYMQREADSFGGVGNIPLTATRKVKRIINANLKELYYRGSMKIKQVNRDSEEDLDILDTMRRAYFSSILYISAAYKNQMIEDVMHADESSCYPWMMLSKKYPYGKFKKIEKPEGITKDNLCDLITGKPRLIRLAFINLRVKYPRFSFLPSNHKYWTLNGLESLDNRIISARYASITLTDVDLANVIEFYDCDKVDIIEIHEAKKYTYLPDYIIKTVIDLYLDKKQGKAKIKEIKKTRRPTIQEQADYDRLKSMVDRVYGIFVQKPIMMQYSFDPVQGEVKPTGEAYAKSDDDCAVLYQWGVWIVAYARDVLLKINAAIGLEIRNSSEGEKKYINNDTVLYCDTDCTKFKTDINAINIINDYNKSVKEQLRLLCWRNNYCKYEELEGIGEFEFEHYQSFKYAGIKRYGYIDDNCKFYPIVSGLAFENVYFDQFATNEEKLEAIDDEMQIPASIARNRRNIYLNSKFEEDVTDYQGNTDYIISPSCVLLTICGFNSDLSEHIEKVDKINIDNEKFAAAKKIEPLKKTIKKK